MTDMQRAIKMIEAALRLIKAHPDEIVRCGDCKFFKQQPGAPFGICEETKLCNFPDWYCADGEENTG